MSDRCPGCGGLYTIIQRTHRCRGDLITQPRVTMVTAEAVVTPAPKVVTQMVTPRRDRAAYMRAYRAARRDAALLNGALGFGA